MADKENKVLDTEKAKKPAKTKKSGKLGDAWRGFKSEFKKIVWPSWKQVRKNTLVVLVVMLVFAVVIALLDIAFSTGMRELTNFFANLFA